MGGAPSTSASRAFSAIETESEQRAWGDHPGAVIGSRQGLPEEGTACEEPECQAQVDPGSPKDSQITEGSLLLCFVVDEKVSIVHRCGQRSMLLPKLRKMEPRGGKDKLGIPDLLVLVGVTGIKVRTLACASLSVGEKTNGNGPSFSGARGSNSCTKVAIATIVVFSLEA